MNNSRQFLALCRSFHTQLVRRAPEEGPRTARLKAIQKKLQVDDGVPVHLKSGVGDKLLYQFTILLTAVGIGLSFDTLYKITTGKKD